ncbi:F0F1 ATP synthase subunit B family protein [Abyssibius alkaniclasticus]|uniref:F0F1 ATP synthase subunit B family protein n=1 Tax=Abyssibius alkaniclasticus TaxID=2881234 RepID=UPI00308255CF|tara:strand:+ start:221 stop:715 length:495 start_codon:yes stop_codon:yes gene_type:complete
MMEFLNDTNIVVTIAFVLFIGVLLYAKVPGKVTSMLDGRATTIRSELDEARALREEAQTLLASYDRKKREVEAQTEEIVAHAKAEARAAAETAKADLKASIARRLEAADEQITAAESRALRSVRDQAVAVAVAAAGEVIAAKMPKADADAMLDAAIAGLGTRLN